jgi:hypothetical protein
VTSISSLDLSVGVGNREELLTCLVASSILLRALLSPLGLRANYMGFFLCRSTIGLSRRNTRLPLLSIACCLRAQEPSSAELRGNY